MDEVKEDMRSAGAEDRVDGDGDPCAEQRQQKPYLPYSDMI